jgi:hypothetical protein
MMKKYTLNIYITLFFALILHLQSSAQVRIVEVDPATETVKLRNYGGSTVDVSGYRLCSLFAYRTLSSETTIQSGSFMLASNADVVVSVAGNYMNDTAADLGLYLPTGSFGSSTAMQDFTQWGSGGNGRESVAVTKGIWTAGTFLNVTPPYEYTGDGGQNGFQFWDTLLGIDEFSTNQFKILQNPASNKLLLSLPRATSSFTLDIFDVLGKKILTKQISGVSPSIDVSKWNSGVYLVRLTSDNVTQTKRFVKQ